MLVTKAQLQTALAFTSKDATRYNLCGVAFEKSGRMIATDGHRIVVLDDGQSIEDGGGESAVILAREGLLAIVKGMTGKTTASIDFDVDAQPGDSFKVAEIDANGGATYRVEIIDGDYPNWRQVFPTKAPELESPVGFNPAYLSDIGTAAKRFGVKRLVMTAYGEFSAVLCEGENPDGGHFRALLMPMRG